eukprot:3467653-Amphidinium_carterae.1
MPTLRRAMQITNTPNHTFAASLSHFTKAMSDSSAPLAHKCALLSLVRLRELRHLKSALGARHPGPSTPLQL